MIKKIFFACFFTVALFGVELSNLGNSQQDTNTTTLNYVDSSASKVFGYNLFNGSFSHSTQYRYNADYLINIGDTVNLKMWGAFDFATKVAVDSKGNIFVPKVGVIKVAGIKNSILTQKVKQAVKKVFKKNVFVYADLESYQPVSVFVTGAVNKPGLYEGLSSDSIIQFLDKARGIDTLSGSFRNIKVLRKEKYILNVDLYSFLTDGKLQLFQFHSGDVIMVESVQHYVEISGDVKRPYRFELKKNYTSLQEILQAVLPNPTLTNFTVTKYDQNNNKKVAIYPIKDNLNMLIHSGDSLNFIPDHRAQQINVAISGEHGNIHNIVVNKGTTLQEVYDNIKLTEMSDAPSFQLYRKSIAEQQKKLLHAQLEDLETKTLTAGSYTVEEATIRKQEAALVMNFIERAKQVEPKGKVVINNNTDLSKVYLEDGDTIYIPKKSYMVIVQGEVMLPGAQTYVPEMSLEEYINSCGGLSQNADDESILVISKSGKVTPYEFSSYGGDYTIQPGDSILVLGEVESKHLQVVKDITQIVYQIAVAAAVVLQF